MLTATSTAAPPTTKQHRPDKSVNGSRFLRPSLKGYRRIFSRSEKLDVVFVGFISFALIADELRLCIRPSRPRLLHAPREFVFTRQALGVRLGVPISVFNRICWMRSSARLLLRVGEAC